MIALYQSWRVASFSYADGQSQCRIQQPVNSIISCFRHHSTSINLKEKKGSISSGLEKYRFILRKKVIKNVIDIFWKQLSTISINKFPITPMVIQLLYRVARLDYVPSPAKALQLITLKNKSFWNASTRESQIMNIFMK